MNTKLTKEITRWNVCKLIVCRKSTLWGAWNELEVFSKLKNTGNYIKIVQKATICAFALKFLGFTLVDWRGQ